MEPAARESLLREYLAIIRRHRWLIVAATLVVPAVALAYSVSQPVRYAATARVLLNGQMLASSPTGGSQAPALQSTPDRIANTQAELARMSPVIDRVLRTPVASRMTAQEFLNASSVAADPNADLLSFTVAAGGKDIAERLATRYATAYTSYRRLLDVAPLRQASAGIERRLAALQAFGRSGTRLYASLKARDNQLQSHEAVQPSAAVVVQQGDTANRVQPMTTRNVLVGVGLGVLLGVALAFLRQAIDARVVTADEVSVGLGRPLLGRLWDAPRSVRKRGALVTIAEPSSDLSQRYRVLRATLNSVMHAGRDEARNTGRCIVVTSATASEGRSTTVANLGVAFACAGRRVALVNADLRPSADQSTSSLDRLFGLDSQPGLADVICGYVDLESAVVDVDVSPDGTNGAHAQEDPDTRHDRPEHDNRCSLWVLPSGSRSADISDPRGSARLDHVLSDLAVVADVILIDSPPLLAAADGLELVKRADATLVVVRVNRINRSTLAELARLLASCPSNTPGFILTGTDEDRQASRRRRPVLVSLRGSLTP